MNTDLFNVERALVQHYKTFSHRNIRIDMKREDALHPEVSGNKLRKLKYNVEAAIAGDFKTILTYGGAFSNHIAATAAAGHVLGLKTIGIIRGEELGLDLEKTLYSNQTLRTAYNYGMQLHFVSREDYRNKESFKFSEALESRYGRYYNIPEGGTNDLAVKGTQEILRDSDRKNYDIITIAAGTGGTAAGIINSKGPQQRVIVFGALKGYFLKDEILKYTQLDTFEFYDDSHFGGYAKSDHRLIDYMNVRFRESEIPLEPIYTGKMMYRLEQLIETGVIPSNSRILAIHTGGLQGIAGYNKRLLKKGNEIIKY